MKDTLVFDVRTIRDGVFNEHKVDIPISQFEFDLDEVQFISSVQGDVKLLLHGISDVYVKAELNTDIELQCGKCLEPFTSNIDAIYEVQFTPNSRTEDVESQDFDDGERYYDGETFDITEDTRKALVLQVPVWPICSEMCEGLCHQCGVNLNEDNCPCEEKTEFETDILKTTSPFAELSQMLEASKLESESE